MKKLILTTLASFSIFAQAETGNVIAELKSVDAVIASVQLTDSGVLTVTRHDGSTAGMQLAKSNVEKLMRTVEELSSAQLATEHRAFVCMMYIAPFNIQNLYIADSQSHTMKMVSSMRSCALRDSTFPKEEYQLNDAETLKSEMIVLAVELARN